MFIIAPVPLLSLRDLFLKSADEICQFRSLLIWHSKQVRAFHYRCETSIPRHNTNGSVVTALLALPGWTLQQTLTVALYQCEVKIKLILGEQKTGHRAYIYIFFPDCNVVKWNNERFNERCKVDPLLTYHQHVMVRSDSRFTLPFHHHYLKNLWE